MSSNRKKTYSVFLLFLLLFCSLIVNAVSAIGRKTENEKLEAARKHIIAHRGASGEAIEHSFEAYDLAIRYGCNYIEQDVVLSSDNVLFVSHDLSAERMTGEKKKYSEMSSKEIKKLHIKNGETIHSLEEVFQRYGDQITYVVELKDNQSEQFVDLVKAYNLEDRIILQSLYKEALENVEPIFPDMKKMLLVFEQNEAEEALDLEYIDIVGLYKVLMGKENIDKIHENGKEVNVWTLDMTDEIKNAIEWGVDTYFTNSPGKAIFLEMDLRAKS